jgi:hypothetical protein
LNATRKVTVVVDGDERLESIQGATDLPMGSREVVLSFGGVSRLTVRVADAGDGGRVLQVESAQPALVLVDGKPRGGTPQSVRGGPKGVALSVSGPGWAVSLGVR